MYDQSLIGYRRRALYPRLAFALKMISTIFQILWGFSITSIGKFRIALSTLDQSMKTKSKISPNILRGDAAALLLSRMIVAFTSAIDLTDRSPKDSNSAGHGAK